MRLFEMSVNPILLGITTIFTSLLPRFSQAYFIEPEYSEESVLIKFMRVDPASRFWPNKGCASDCHWEVHNGTLHIWDTYVPEDMRGKGFLTEVLKGVRHLNGINGIAVVHVTANEGWPKILANAGFIQKPVE